MLCLHALRVPNSLKLQQTIEFGLTSTHVHMSGCTGVVDTGVVDTEATLYATIDGS